MQIGTLSNNKEILKAQFIHALLVMCVLELIHSAASLIDSFFMGKYIGSYGMAAIGYARPFFSFVDIVCGPLGLGMQLVCSRYIGKGELKNAQRTFSASVSAGLVVSLLFVIFGLTNTRTLTLLHGKNSSMTEVLPLAEQYLRGLILGIPAMILFGILSPIVQLGSGKKLIHISLILQLISDVIADALSVFVFHGGTFGLGLATTVSYYFSLIPLLIYFSRGNAVLNLHFTAVTLPDLRAVTKAGMSKAIKRVSNTIKPIIINALSVYLGTSLALSAYSITTQVRDFLISFSAGITGATLLIGALLYSRRDRTGLKFLSEMAFISNGFLAVLGGICIIFSDSIAVLFVTDSIEVIKMASLSIRCVGIMIPFATFNGILISFLQITQQYKRVNRLSYLNRLILPVLFSTVFGFCFGTNGLWWAIPAAEIVNAVVFLLLICRKLGRFPRKTVDFLCLPEDFSFRAEDYIEHTVRNAEEVMELQRIVKEFCRSHEIDIRRSTFTRLALEELCMYTIDSGFPETNNPVIHVWITYEDGDVHLRFQDNCPGFNVMKHCMELQERDEERSVGLRIVSKFAKSMNYENTLDTNNLIITL